MSTLYLWPVSQQPFSYLTFSILNHTFFFYPCSFFPGCGFIYAVDWRPPGGGPPADLRRGAGQDEPSSGCQDVWCFPLTCPLPSRPEANYCAAPAGKDLVKLNTHEASVFEFMSLEITTDNSYNICFSSPCKCNERRLLREIQAINACRTIILLKRLFTVHC